MKTRPLVDLNMSALQRKESPMNQTPAAILVLAASIFSYVAQTASINSEGQASVMLTLTAIAVGLWGMVSLFSATMREREKLIDSSTRLEVLDRMMESEPVRAIKEASQRITRPETSKPKPDGNLSAELEAQLNAISQLSGRDRSEILEETLRNHLPRAGASRAA